jgi:dienelactone hydrolase
MYGSPMRFPCVFKRDPASLEEEEQGMINPAGLLAFRIFAILIAPLPQATAMEQAGFALPSPNGCYAVGTRTDVLRDVHRNRDLLVTMWYPAAGGTASPAPYMDQKTADALAEDWKLQPGFERLVGTHARLSAPIAEEGGRFPVVFLEHGSGVVPAIYTVLAEGLASSGFIVVATNHPSASLISVFPDGHELKFAPFWPAEADRRTQGVAIGKFVDEVLVADVRFVLDELQEMNSRQGFWHNRLDLSEVGIVGHSLGGATAALATQGELRIRAGVNLDGSTYPGMNADVRPVPIHKPLLFLATEEHASGTDRAREYVGSESNTYYVVMKGADHGSFTDAKLLSSRFSRDSKADQHAFDAAVLRIELTRGLVEQFLGKYLKGATAPDLDVPVEVDKK